MPTTTTTYIIKAVFDARDAGQTFGPFSERGTAEACVIALASRADVLSATVETRTN